MLDIPRLKTCKVIFTPKDEWYALKARSRIRFTRRVTVPTRSLRIEHDGLKRGIKGLPTDTYRVDELCVSRLQIALREQLVGTPYPLLSMSGHHLHLETAKGGDDIMLEVWNPTTEQILVKYLRLEGVCPE